MTDTTGMTGTWMAGNDSAGTTGDATRDVAKDEARGVAQDAMQSGKQTADTAKQQAGQVAGEARDQARMLLDQTRDQLTEQGSVQQQRAAGGLRSLADELSGMTSGAAAQQGIATDLARQASDRARAAADWLEGREPAEILGEVRRFARRRPGTFLLGAAAAGFLGGRLTRGIVEETRDDSAHDSANDSANDAAQAISPEATPAPAPQHLAGGGLTGTPAPVPQHLADGPVLPEARTAEHSAYDDATVRFSPTAPQPDESLR